MQYVVPQAASAEEANKKLNFLTSDPMQPFGVVSADGMPVDSAFHYRSGRCLTDVAGLNERYISNKDFQTLNGNWFFGGIVFPHFGHFVTESIHRLRKYLESPDTYDGVVFIKSHLSGQYLYDPFEIEYIRVILLEYFGISKERIYFVDSFTQIENLSCFEQDQTLGGHPDREYVDFLGNLEKEFLSKTTSTSYYEKIFLSRQHYLNYGRMLGMDAVQNVYIQNGYQVIYPEKHSIADQLMMLGSAKKVVCEAGSALHLLDMSGKKAFELTILSRRGFDSQFWRNMYETRVARFNCFERVLPMHQYFGTNPGNGHSLAHIQFLLLFLKGAGLDFDEQNFISDIKYSVSADIRRCSLSLVES